MPIDWEQYFPWASQPSITKTSQESGLTLYHSVFISHSEFFSIDDAPAVSASQIEIQCFIDYTTFFYCSGSPTISFFLFSCGSFVVSRSAFYRCSLHNNIDCNAIKAELDESLSGLGILLFTSFADCFSDSNKENKYNIYLRQGSYTFEHINTSKCQSEYFAAFLIENSLQVLVQRSNYASNTAKIRGIIYFVKGIIRNCNIINNVEIVKDPYYSGVITSNGYEGDVLTVEQCFIKDNTYLSNIPNGPSIKFLRCCISGSDLSTSGSVSIIASKSFNRLIIPMYSTKDVIAEIPYREFLFASCLLQKIFSIKMMSIFSFNMIG